MVNSISFNRITETSFDSRMPLHHTLADQAAIKIQKCFRGHLARRSFVSSKLYSKYRVLADKTDSMPRADSGQTWVFLPKEMPAIVLKSSGKENAIRRFHVMQEVRTLLTAQKSTHLIIPQARLYQDFLVEERLPINTDSFYNMGLYFHHPKLFDTAICELTKLFSKIYIDDLVNYQYKIPLSHIEGVKDLIRYDNLPFYIVENNGKKEARIGLIDLEQFTDNPSPEAVSTLVRIFPLHLELIKQEACRLKMEYDAKELDSVANKGIKFLKVGYVDHLERLKKKGISNDISDQTFQISPERYPTIAKVVEKELLKINEGFNDFFERNYSYKRSGLKPQKKFLTENPEAVAREISVSVTKFILSHLTKEIERVNHKRTSKLSTQQMTDAELVKFRSPILKRTEGIFGCHKNSREWVYDLIGEHPKVKFEDESVREDKDVAEQLLYVILEELVRGGEIFYFDPAYYAGGHDLCWVRY